MELSIIKAIFKGVKDRVKSKPYSDGNHWMVLGTKDINGNQKVCKVLANVINKKLKGIVYIAEELEHNQNGQKQKVIAFSIHHNRTIRQSTITELMNELYNYGERLTMDTDFNEFRLVTFVTKEIHEVLQDDFLLNYQGLYDKNLHLYSGSFVNQNHLREPK